MLKADAVVDRSFLETRCLLIEIAGTLDRFDRACARNGGDDDLDPGRAAQMEKLQKALEILAAPNPPAALDDRCRGAGRAESLLNLFTD